MSRLILIAVITLVLVGCMSENTGSLTVVGEQLILPEMSDGSDLATMRIYESIKGARIWTAKDSLVTVSYSNYSTNSYFGVIDSYDTMTLNVKIEPLDMGEGGEMK